MGDRFFQDIRVELAERAFDPNVFEECVCDLLRDTYPGIVPVRGGDDAGMDAAIPTETGPPIPVIITTQEDVIGNLTRNMDRYLAKEGRQRRAVLATSRELTPRRRRNLEARAEEKGFDLQQVFDGFALAQRFYCHPEWCRDLLGLNGQPASLSEVPPTRRPLLPLELIGRDADLRWLREIEGDGVLLGEPGSGKTFLLDKLVREGEALFLVSTDETAIANDLRRSEPRLVIVDDAHADLQRIDLLRRLRRDDVGAKFSILATAWPWPRYQDDILEALGGLPHSRIHTLGPLTRDEIVEVLKQVGIHEPTELVRAVVDQSGNKPGLAVTLGLLCFQGDVLSVVRGKALSRNLLSIFRNQIGPYSASDLACFAVGGEAGMAYNRVAEYLGRPLAEMREGVTGLAAGGVLKTLAQGVLAVEPLALRAALVRDEILDETAPLDYLRLVEMAEDPSSAVDAVVAGVAYGAAMDREDLQRLLCRHGSKKAWQTLAALDAEGAAWARLNYPGSMLEIAGPALHSAPKSALRWFLEAAEDDDSVQESVFETLGLWISDADQVQSTLLERRRDLADEAVAHLGRGGSVRLFWRSFRLFLSVSARSSRRDPGAGMTVKVSHGRITRGGVEEIVRLWRSVRETAVRAKGPQWSVLKDLLREWLDSDSWFPGGTPPEEDREALLALSREVLVALAPHFEGHPGAASEIHNLASKLDIEVGLSLDPDFETLYPRDGLIFDVSEEERAVAQEALLEMAAAWSEQSSSSVATRLSFYEAEAAGVDRAGPRLTPRLALELAHATDRPAEWLQSFTEAEVRPDLVLPFLDRLLTERQTGWSATAEQLLATNRYKESAAERILTLRIRSTRLQESAVSVAEEDAELVEQLCRRGDVSEEVVRRFLRSPSAKSSLGAVIGLWWPPGRELSLSLRESWRSAVLRLRSSENDYGELVSSRDWEYWLGKILAANQDLAFEWVKRRLSDDHRLTMLSRRGVFSHAIEVLDPRQRLEILSELSPDRSPRGLVALLVGRNAVLYRQLLARSDLEQVHLAPLYGEPDEAWWELARLAVDSGYSPEIVADAALGSPWIIIVSGDGIDQWQRYEEEFAREEGSSEVVTRDIAEAGLQLVRERLRKAQERARRRAVEGAH